jgi:glycosyltransferase involved in cell wall biosynthesis
MGDGELRNVMETFILNNNLNNIILTGFVNQSQISKYYSISDLLVMCSDVGETWGLAVNEAMNFGLPIITYDMAGCAYDLIDNGKNGFIIPVGDIDKLAVAIEEVLKDDVISRYAEVNSGSILNQYSYEKIIQGLSLIIQNENTVYTTQ